MLEFIDIVMRLSNAHGIDMRSTLAFNARIKRLILLLIPQRMLGKGRRSAFTEADYRKLYYAVELGALGMLPERSAEIVTENIDELERVAKSGGSLELSVSSALPSGADPMSSIILRLPKLFD